MKANKTFKQADEAVSPVIGVILMVAITVVLAAVVFVLVGNLSTDDSAAPSVGWQTDEAKDRLTVIKAPADVQWSEFDISTDATNTVYFNVSATAYADLSFTNGDSAVVGFANEPTRLADAATMAAGNYLEFCASTAETGVTVTISHTASGQVVKQETLDLAIC